MHLKTCHLVINEVAIVFILKLVQSQFSNMVAKFSNGNFIYHGVATLGSVFCQNIFEWDMAESHPMIQNQQ